MSLPKFLQSVLWSYDIKKIDIKTDKELIIQQVLNWGTEKQLKWLFKTYSKKEIKHVLRYSRRGSWQANVLNFWLRVFDIKLNKDTYELAIFDLVPSIKKQKLLAKVFKT